jgi:hypothetical protein
VCDVAAVDLRRGGRDADLVSLARDVDEQLVLVTVPECPPNPMLKDLPRT